MSARNTIKHEGKFLTVYETESGWEFVSRKQFMNYREGNKKVDAVIIVPILRGENGNHRIVITNEWRQPLNTHVWGFPAGLVDAGESGFDAAKRELKEETGLDCVKILHNTPRLFSSEGLTDECVSVIYVEACGTISKDNLEANENIDCHIMDHGQAFHLLNDGEAYNFGKAVYFIMQDFVNTKFSWLMDKE